MEKNQSRNIQCQASYNPLTYTHSLPRPTATHSTPCQCVTSNAKTKHAHRRTDWLRCLPVIHCCDSAAECRQSRRMAKRAAALPSHRHQQRQRVNQSDKARARALSEATNDISDGTNPSTHSHARKRRPRAPHRLQLNTLNQ